MNLQARLVLALVAALVCAALPAQSFAARWPYGSIVTPPQSPGAPGPPADGSSGDPAFSQDDRMASVLAFDSVADNLVAGDTNGRRDVFVLHKSSGTTNTGGTLERVSVSWRGGQANGDSSRPSVDGTGGVAPRCVSFQSSATNLVPRARVRGSAIFLRNIRRRTTALVSAGFSHASHASIDGRCRYVSFESHGRVLVRDLRAKRTLLVARGEEPDLQTDGRGLAYERRGQVYYQALRATRHGLSRSGRPRVASAAAGGVPGNGISDKPALDDHGHYVAFESTATNLCVNICGIPYHPPPNWRTLDPGDTPGGRDANGPVSDIYRASLQVPTGSADSMSLMSYDVGYDQLNGPSTNPTISRAGHEVVFQTAATNFGGVKNFGAGLGTYTSIMSAYSSGVNGGGAHLHLESYGVGPSFRSPFIDFNGPSIDPAMSSRGNYIAYATAETGYGGELNGPGLWDVMLTFAGPNTDGLPTY